MSTPNPDVQVLMFKDMLNRSYKFYIGDICEVTAGCLYGEQVEIWYPYFYDYDGEQTYITKKTPKREESFLRGSAI